MKKFFPFLPFCALALLAGFFFFFIKTHPITLFNSKGYIAQKESQLITTFIVLMLCVALPAVALTFFTAWRFRSTNPKATYSPNAKHNTLLEIVWWIVPTCLVIILATITWVMTHKLDPVNPISQSTKPLPIQVVALRWKWLFIYPTEGIATVNFIEFPVKTQVNFLLTADAPMNSFWIPNLGGQMYAMTGMINQLHLQADQTGDFPGSAAEISGKGFAGMRFTARAVSKKDFDAWITKVKQSKNSLTISIYNALSQPSENTPTMLYAHVDSNLYNEVVSKYMEPTGVENHDE